MTPTAVQRLARRATAAAVTLAAAVFAFAPAPEAAAQPGGGAPELALVPADAAGFVHVRAADIWKSDVFAELRKTWERAGAKAIADLDKQFVPAPSSMARATGFVIMSAEKGPMPVGILSFSAPFNPADVAKTYLPNGRARKSGGKTIYTSPGGDNVALYMPDNQTIVVTEKEVMTDYLSRPVAKDGPLAPALKLAAAGKAVVAAANIASLPIPPGALGDLPPSVQPILKADTVVVTLDLGKDAVIGLKAGYKNAAAADAAQAAVKDLVKLGRAEIAKAKTEMEKKLNDPDADLPRKAEDLPEAIASVFALGALGRADDFLADPTLVTRTGNDLSVSVTVPKEFTGIGAVGAVGVGFALPAVQKVREAAGRASSSNNLKQIGIAVHNYHDVMGKFPADIKDKTGKAILSWRVEILPYIEQENVYRMVKRDEPWDSPANKEMAKVQIKTFMSPNATNNQVEGGYGVTHYRGVKGKGMAFDPTVKQLRFVDFTDGTSNTIMVVESGDPVAWMRPDDLTIPEKGPLPRFDVPGRPGQFNALFADGSVRWINRANLNDADLRAYFTRNGGEVVRP
jgi:prepilin-type processing-associated H-X9-DG protein